MQSYRPIAEIIQDVIDDIQEIIRSEFRLAKAETRDELSKAAKSSGILAAGIVFGLYALGFLFLTTMFGLGVALRLATAPAHTQARGIWLYRPYLLVHRFLRFYARPSIAMHQLKEHIGSKLKNGGHS